MDPHDHLDRLRTMVEDARPAGCAPGLARRFDRVLEAITATDAALLDLQDVVVLSEVTLDGLDMAASGAVWQDLAPDVDHRDVRALVSASPTLAALDRVGIDVLAVRRYGQEHLEAARAIGRWCADHPTLVGHLAPRPPRPGARTPLRFTIPAGTREDVVRLLVRLGELGVLEGFDVEGQVVGRDGSSYWRSHARTPPRVAPQTWAVRRGRVAPAYEPFLQGHWLTAHAYAIAEDVFGRDGAGPHEAFTNLQYHLPDDMGGGHSDIDLLVRTHDQIVVVECKAGWVLRRFGQDRKLDKVVANAAHLERVLDASGVPLQRTYVLLHTGTEAPRDIERELAGSSPPITVVEPAGLRPLMVRLASR